MTPRKSVLFKLISFAIYFSLIALQVQSKNLKSKLMSKGSSKTDSFPPFNSAQFFQNDIRSSNQNILKDNQEESEIGKKGQKEHDLNSIKRHLETKSFSNLLDDSKEERINILNSYQVDLNNISKEIL